MLCFDFEQDTKENTLIKQEEHLHFWHIYNGLQSTRGEKKIVLIYQSAQVKSTYDMFAGLAQITKPALGGSTSAQHILKAACIVIKCD